MRVFRRNDRDGSYWVDYVDGNGKRHRRRIGTSRREADTALAAIRVASVRNDWGLLSQNVTVAAAIERYMARCKTACCEERVRRVKYALDLFTRFLQERHPALSRLKNLRAQHVQEFMAWRLEQPSRTRKDKPIARATVNLDLLVVKGLLNYCVDNDWLQASPARKVGRLKMTDSVKVRALKPDEAALLIEKLRGHWLFPAVFTMLHAGLRLGECRELRVGDVDVDAGIIHIRAKPGWVPKSSGGDIREREIFIGPALVEFLREHLKTPSDGLVFHNARGGKLSGSATHTFSKFCKRIGLDCTRLHALRHTYGTMLARNGANIAVIQEQLGHRDIATTRQYVDAQEDSKRVAAKTLVY